MKNQRKRKEGAKGNTTTTITTTITTTNMVFIEEMTSEREKIEKMIGFALN